MLSSALAAGCGSNTKPIESTFDADVMDVTIADAVPSPPFKGFDAAPEACAPRTCTELGYDCGENIDNCGNVIAGGCGTCPAGKICGAGGFSKCGGGASEGGPDSGCGSGGCCPETCSQQGLECGPAGDGCGGLIPSCGTCASPASCGGGGAASVCGGGGEAGIDGCVPRTCQQMGIQCGFAGDGCGNPLVCGSCPPPTTCGGGGTPNVCGGDSAPTDAGDGGPTGCRTCAELGYQCGPAGDGCGNVLSCGTCPSPLTCGGAGAFQCGGGDACVSMTCAQQGFGCGPQGDGCGNLIQCGTCPAGQTCGGPTGHSVCVATCPTCPPPTPCDVGLTSISGRVVAGTLPAYGAPDPVPNVVAYVPSSPVLPFAPGVACGQCGADLSGNPIVKTTTAVDGSFQLDNVPVMSNMPLVIQLGRWRKQVTVPTVASCTNTPVGTITMPRTHLEGDIPLTAISTGNVDAMECVLLKMGVDPSEFSFPASVGGTGRIQLFVGNGANEGFGNPKEAALTTSPSTLAAYDEVLLPCWGVDPTLNGSPNAKTAAEQQNLVDYTSAGGRMFATHYSYAWLYDAPAFSTTAKWNLNASAWPSVEASIDTSLPATQTFASWMSAVGASLPNGQFDVQAPRHDFDSVVAPAVRWVFTPDHESFPLQYTFDTPYNGTRECGRVIFSDFHVTSNNNTSGLQFPTECNAAPMTPQEKALEYLLWDLAACVPPQGCVPLTCAEQGVACGPAGDGCNGVLDCGPCPPPPDGCVPETCAQENLSCGPAGDGCGNKIQCGMCPSPETCGGGGVNGKCGSPPPPPDACVPRTCAQQGVQCGYVGDGCGGLAGSGGDPPSCGTCSSSKLCMMGQCVAADGGCSKVSCGQQGISCGPAGDGCGGLQECGSCPAGQVCGGTCAPGTCCAGNN